MDKYNQQLQKDFSSWGKIFTPSDLLTDDNSPINRLLEQGFSIENTKLVLSVCPDDINRLPQRDTIEKTLKKTFGGEFHLGNLAGYPIGGLTGIVAASHHVPYKIIENKKIDGKLVFFISPHVGLAITQSETIYGQIFRPGQQTTSNCCGAMMGFLHHLRHAGKIEDIDKIAENDKDPMMMILFKELLDDYSREVGELLKIFEMNNLVIEASKLNYKLIMGKFKAILQGFLDKKAFQGEYAIIGGITINTMESDYFIFRDYTLNSLPP